MVFNPETLSIWVSTLTPILESKTFSLMLALGFAFFVYWSSNNTLEQQQANNRELWLYIQASHAKQMALVVDLRACRDIRPGQGFIP